MGGDGEQRQECSVSACPPAMPYPGTGSSTSILEQQIPHSFSACSLHHVHPCGHSLPPKHGHLQPSTLPSDDMAAAHSLIPPTQAVRPAYSHCPTPEQADYSHSLIPEQAACRHGHFQTLNPIYSPQSRQPVRKLVLGAGGEGFLAVQALQALPDHQGAVQALQLARVGRPRTSPLHTTAS